MLSKEHPTSNPKPKKRRTFGIVLVTLTSHIFPEVPGERNDP